MLDHLLRLLKERAAVAPALADRRQDSAGSWASLSPAKLELRSRVVAAVAQVSGPPSQSRDTVSDFQPPLSPAIQGHDCDRPAEKASSHAKSAAPRSGLATWPTQTFAPYVDIVVPPMYDIAAVARNQGVRFFTLAFITADPRNRPAWGGHAEYGVGESEWDRQIQTQIQAVRAAGGDVMVSFGGGKGKELAEQITDLAALTAAYRQVIDACKLTHIDFDIEGAAQRDRASIDRRSRAIAALQREAATDGRTLQVWFTLPILPTGLTADGLRSVKSAVEHGVKITGVNGMTMEFGDRNAPNPAGKMGTYSIQAAKSLFQQLKALCGTDKRDEQIWKMVGATPMIGQNNVRSEVFRQSDARELTAWANQQEIGRLSMWSLNRDQADPAGRIDRVSSRSSSLEQTPFEFSQIFTTIHK